MRSIRSFVALFLHVFAAVATATVLEPEVTLVGIGDPPVLEDGQAYEIPVEIRVAGGAELQSARAILGRGLPLAQLEASLSRAVSAPLDGSTRSAFIVRGVHKAGKNPRIEAVVDGVVHELELDLFDGRVDEPVETPIVEAPRISLDGLDAPSPAGIEDLDPPTLARSARDVRVTGRITIDVQSIRDGPIEARGVDGVTVKLVRRQTFIDDEVYGVGVTDANGDFSFIARVDDTDGTVVRIETENGDAVKVGNGTFFSTYRRASGVDDGFTGNLIDIGTWHFGFGTRMNVPLFLTSTITRAHRWLAGQGIEPSRVSIHFPDDGGRVSFYSTNPGSEGIHIRTMSARNAGTILHEYGHHWVNEKADSRPPSYCNGLCDDNGGCGHCAWCEENPDIAWSEGYANFFSWHLAEDHNETYGWPLPSARNAERVFGCGRSDDLDFDDPTMTHGFLSALAQDLVDLENENGLGLDGAFADRMSLPPVFPYEVAMNGRASNAPDYVQDLYEALLVTPGIGPAEIADFWSTVRYNGLVTDDTAPTAPTSVTSPSHPIGFPSPSAQPSFIFGGATDATTGVQGYYVDIHSAPREPAPGGEYLGVGDEVWPRIIAPGDWYANVRAVDAAGNESLDWISYGPFTVSDPVPVDLTPVTDLFWEAPLIVRNTPDALPGAVAWQPNLLPGSLYFNLLFKNDSLGSAAVGDFEVRFSIDGRTLHVETIPAGSILPGQLFELQNIGPFTIPPGRHTIVARVDGSGRIAETDETNNTAAVVVVADPRRVTPAPLGAPAPVTVAGPGLTNAGVAELGFDPLNQSAVVFTPSTRFTVISARSVDGRMDYDLRAYEPHTDSFTGLDSPIGRVASTDAGSTHMVIDRDAFSGSDVEVGVECRFRPDCADFEVKATNVFPFSLAATATTVLNPTFGEDVDIIVFEFDVDAASVGYLRAKLEGQFSRYSEYNRLRGYWVRAGDPIPFATSEATPLVARAGEPAVATLDVPQAGKYLLVLLKSPAFNIDDLVVEGRIELERIPRPELVLPAEDPIWDFGLIPLPSPSQDDSLSFPDQLVGDVSGTFVNFALINTGAVVAPIAPVELLFEGEALEQIDLGPIPPGGRVEFRSPTPLNIPGGRRTLAVEIDPNGLVEEFEEHNNLFAVQFGWSGPSVVGQTITRGAPPEPDIYANAAVEVMRPTQGADGETGPMEFVTRWAPNCDGLRLEPSLLRSTAGTWVGAAISPKTAQDYDLRLFEGDLPPNASFVQPLATSSWAIGRTEFVLVSGGLDRPFDLGVYATAGDDPYDAYGTRSEFMGTLSDGFTTLDTYRMSSGELLDLYEFELEPGAYTVNLFNQSVIHLGMSVHAPLSEDLTNFHGKDALLDQVPNGWGNPAGQGQTSTFVVREGEQGRWCIAVWRQSVADSNVDAFYSLEIETQLSAPAAVRVDGFLDPVAYGYALLTQEVGTAFGDNDDPRLDLANGSELDGAYATIVDDMLYLMLTGNLESNGNDLEIFFDTRTGGMNRLRGDRGDVPSGALARMGDDGSGNGLRFDTSFDADFYVSASGALRGLDGTIEPYLFDVQMAEITELEVQGRYLGSSFAAQRGRLYGGGDGTAAPGNLLVNPGFESPALTGADAFGGGTGWSVYGSSVFTVTQAFAPPHRGTQALKLFGSCCNGVYQEFPTEPGEAWTGSAWVLNESGDPLENGQVGSVAIEWFQADGSTQSVIQPFVSNGETDAGSIRGQWTRRTIRGVAPDDAAFVRFTLITGDFLPGGPGGAVFFDDAVFQRERPAEADATDPNPFAVLAAINNANLVGVGAGTGPDDGNGVTTGMEFGIPLAALGNPDGCIAVSAFVNGRLHDFVSNQTLGPLPAGTDFLGEPRDVDFAAIPGNQFFWVCPDVVVAVDEPAVPQRSRTEFHEPTPNPFNPRTTLAFSLADRRRVELTLYAANGRRVRELIRAEIFESGRHEVVWNGLDGSGRPVASGVYFARLEAGDAVMTQRMILLK